MKTQFAEMLDCSSVSMDLISDRQPSASEIEGPRFSDEKVCHNFQALSS